MSTDNKTRLLANYTNGNYKVKLFSDGTKIRYNDLDNLTPDFAESMDITITMKCNGGCNFCYLNCNEHGQHADLNQPILDTVHAGTEIALNGNDLTHPDLENFLIRMKDKGAICNITINQMHLLANVDKLVAWQSRELVWGIGISLTNSADSKFYETIDRLNNTVIHVIDGCFTKTDLENLADHNLKLLVLGFKHKGRGVEYYEQHKEEVDANIEFLTKNLYSYRNRFNGFGFDTLATNDLDIRNQVGEKAWAAHHMGEEGEFTMFVDLVNKQYAISSMETEHIFDLKEDDTVDSIFKHIRHVAGHE